MNRQNTQGATFNVAGEDHPSAKDELSKKSVAELQKLLADEEAKFAGLKDRSLEWDAVRKAAAAVRATLFDLTGDLYGRPTKKIRRPDDELLDAKYDSPEDIPAEVLAWVRKSGLLTTDASDAVRWSRIIGTRQHSRYEAGGMSIFRAVALDDEISDDIRPGDWVSSERKYAEEHLKRYLGGNGTILEVVVDGRDVLVSPTGNFEEAIYAPLDLSGPLLTASAEQPRVAPVVSQESAVPAVSTDQFKQWLGASKVARWDGSPTVVYHGTRVSEDGIGDIQFFDRKFTQQALNRAQNIDMIGSWFSDNHDADGALMYAGANAHDEAHGGVIYPAYLAIQNPKEFGTFDELLAEFKAFHLAGPVSLDDRERNARKVQFGSADGFVDYMKGQGFDGIKIAAHSDHRSREFVDQNVWIAFNAEQVRFALSPLVPRLAAEYAVLSIDDTATAAFEDIGRNREIALILKEAAVKVAAGETGFVLHDTNGNAVGRFELGAKPDSISNNSRSGQVRLSVTLDHSALVHGRSAALSAVIGEVALRVEEAGESAHLPLAAIEPGVVGVLDIGPAQGVEVEHSMARSDGPEF